MLMEAIFSTNGYKVLPNNEPEEHEQEVDECPVCYCTDRSFSNAFQCSHKFCDECIGKLSDTRKKTCCPLCRSNLKEQPPTCLSKWHYMDEMMIIKERELTLNPLSHPLLLAINNLVRIYTNMKEYTRMNFSDEFAREKRIIQQEAEKLYEKYLLASRIKSDIIKAEESRNSELMPCADIAYTEKYLDILECDVVFKIYNSNRLQTNIRYERGGHAEKDRVVASGLPRKQHSHPSQQPLCVQRPKFTAIWCYCTRRIHWVR